MKVVYFVLLALLCSVSFSSYALTPEQKEEDTRYYNQKLEQKQWDEQHRRWLEQKHADEAHIQDQKREQDRVDAQKREQQRVEDRIEERKREDKRRDDSRR